MPQCLILELAGQTVVPRSHPLIDQKRQDGHGGTGDGFIKDDGAVGGDGCMDCFQDCGHTGMITLQSPASPGSVNIAIQFDRSMNRVTHFNNE